MKRKVKQNKKAFNYAELYDLTGIKASQVIAEKFEKWSISRCKIQHKFNPSDGWSTLSDSGYYQRVDEEEKISIYIKKYLGKCTRIEKGHEEPIPITKYLVENS